MPVFSRQVQRGRGRSWRRIYRSWRRRGIRSWGTSPPIWRSWGSSGWGDDRRDARSPRWTSWEGQEATIFECTIGRTRWQVRRSWRCTGWSRARRSGRSSRRGGARGARGGKSFSFSGNDEWQHSRIYLENYQTDPEFALLLDFVYSDKSISVIYYIFVFCYILTSQFQ